MTGEAFPLAAWLLPVGELLARGGAVMWAIFAATALLWALILERYLFHWLAWPRLSHECHRQWQARAERASWFARQVRGELVARASEALRRRLGLVRALTALLPLLGLLGCSPPSPVWWAPSPGSTSATIWTIWPNAAPPPWPVSWPWRRDDEAAAHPGSGSGGGEPHPHDRHGLHPPHLLHRLHHLRQGDGGPPAPSASRPASSSR